MERKTLQYGQFRGVQKWLKNHCCYNVTFILAENVGKTAIARSVLTVGAPAVLHGSLGRKNKGKAMGCAKGVGGRRDVAASRINPELNRVKAVRAPSAAHLNHNHREPGLEQLADTDMIATCKEVAADNNVY